MQASVEKVNREHKSGKLPLDSLLNCNQIPHCDDDDEEDDVSSEEGTVVLDDSPSTSVVYCRWYNCRKMFKAGTYLCADVELFMDHIKRDHINPVHVEEGGKVQCLWEFNRCHEEIAGEDILKHVEEHFKNDEYTREAYPNPTLAPKQWVYCLWKGCHKLFVDRDVGEIWWNHIWWDHILEPDDDDSDDDGGDTDATAGAPCEWTDCEDWEKDCGLAVVARHVQKHLADEMRYGSDVCAGIQ